MNTANVNLEQVLGFREERAEIQRGLLGEFGLPLISFTMNIAGAQKRGPLIDFAFSAGVGRVLEELGEPRLFRRIDRDAGSAAFFVCDAPADALKRLCVRLEDGSGLGRLLDLDVIGADGVKLSRAGERSCIVCGGPVAPCARSRAHGLEELRARTENILKEFAFTALGRAAVQALLDEVRLTPKPGLVDGENSGAHSDMDIALMEKSALSLSGYFPAVARLGYERPDNFIALLRRAGLAAEKSMFAATGGVNTHKGAIFSLGLLCAAYGASLAEGGADVFGTAAGFASALRSEPADTHGAAVRRRYGGSGVFAEALSGFPHVRRALGVLSEGGSPQSALLTLLSEVEDSNLLWRGGREGLLFVQREAGRILSLPECERDGALRLLDRQCVERNLSPGGCADLLAAALFLDGVGRAAADSI